MKAIVYDDDGTILRIVQSNNPDVLDVNIGSAMCILVENETSVDPTTQKVERGLIAVKLPDHPSPSVIPPETGVTYTTVVVLPDLQTIRAAVAKSTTLEELNTAILSLIDISLEGSSTTRRALGAPVITGETL